MDLDLLNRVRSLLIDAGLRNVFLLIMEGRRVTTVKLCDEDDLEEMKELEEVFKEYDRRTKEKGL